jgi:hypothetical protein
METSIFTKFKELISLSAREYECGSAEPVETIYTKCGLRGLMYTFATEIMREHIKQYTDQFPEIPAEFEEKYLEAVEEIISSNMDMGDSDPIINEVENYCSWAEMDVDNFMSEIENFIDGDTPIPDTEPTPEPIDNIDSVWKTEDEAWSCDDKNEPEQTDPQPVKWDNEW